MKKLSDITSKFKMTKFRVQMSAQAAADVQKAMFVMGFRSDDSQPGQKRVPDMRPVVGTAIHAFYIDSDCRIHCSGHPNTFGQIDKYREVAILEVFEASKEFKALKKELRKQRQLEKKVAREGWIPNTGVFVSGAIEVLFRDGTTRDHAGSWTIPYCGNADKTVVAYKLPQAHAPISLQDMVTNIVTDAGGKEVTNDGFIVWNGGECPIREDIPLEIKFRHDAHAYNCKNSFGLRWTHEGGSGDVVAYRVIKQPDVMIEVPEVDPAPMAPDTNPKKQYGLASIPLHLWSPLASAYGAVSLYNGSLKYGRCNYMGTPVEASIYIAAAMRHLLAWAEGEEFDPADECPNLGGVLANIAIILEARAVGTLIDDRQLTGGYLKERDALKALVKRLGVLHAGKDPRHYTIADNKAV